MTCNISIDKIHTNKMDKGNGHPLKFFWKEKHSKDLT